MLFSLLLKIGVPSVQRIHAVRPSDAVQTATDADVQPRVFSSLPARRHYYDVTRSTWEDTEGDA